MAKITGRIGTTLKNKKMEIVYHFLVLLTALFAFFTEINGPSRFWIFLLKVLGKIVPFVCMVYSVTQLFKYFGI